MLGVGGYVFEFMIEKIKSSLYGFDLVRVEFICVNDVYIWVI